MSKRLQVLMPDREMAEIKRSARTEGVSVGEWVRRNLRDARNRKPGKGVESKLAVIRRDPANSDNVLISQRLACADCPAQERVITLHHPQPTPAEARQ